MIQLFQKAQRSHEKILFQSEQERQSKFHGYLAIVFVVVRVRVRG